MKGFPSPHSTACFYPVATFEVSTPSLLPLPFFLLLNFSFFILILFYFPTLTIPLSSALTRPTIEAVRYHPYAHVVRASSRNTPYQQVCITRQFLMIQGAREDIAGSPNRPSAPQASTSLLRGRHHCHLIISRAFHMSRLKELAHRDMAVRMSGTMRRILLSYRFRFLKPRISFPLIDGGDVEY